MLTKEVAKEIKKSLLEEFQEIEGLSVKCSKGIIKVTWYNVELEKIQSNIYKTVSKLIKQHGTIFLNGIELWKNYSLDFMNNNNWMRLKRSYKFKF